MPRVTVTRRVHALRCSKESFADFCRDVLDHSDSERETVYLSLTLPKSRTLRGSFAPSEIAELPELDRAKTVYLSTDRQDSSTRITLSVSDAGGQDYLEVDADSEESAERIATELTNKLRQRRPWFWPFKTLFAMLSVLVFAIGGTVLLWTVEWADWLAIGYLLVYIPAVSITTFTRRLQIGTRAPSKIRSGLASSAKWGGTLLLGVILTKVVDWAWDHMW